MPETFYFYDLETSGLSPRSARIMQFAGQRTDAHFQPIGEPANLLIELAEDTLPSPQAVMVTGITPQATHRDGISERDFCQFFLTEVATPGTTIMGYNSIRFDDEFIRHTLWRNFCDPYSWQWQDGRSRWDLLDVVRMTRALRPDGINWPVTAAGKPTNRLELLSHENHIAHQHAHDALSDVDALIGVTRLLQERQPQLFDYLYQMRHKRRLAALVDPENPQPFVYSSGRYPTATAHTTVAYPIAPAPNGAVWVFDLRHNLDELLQSAASGESAAPAAAPARPAGASKSAAAAGRAGTAPAAAPDTSPAWPQFFPIVKKLQYNRCPAVAPLGVLSRDDGWARLGLTPDAVQANLAALQRHPEFVQQIASQPPREFAPPEDPESALYDGFLGDHDTLLCQVVRNNSAEDLADFHPDFRDDRLSELLLHYKAKNFPTALAADEIPRWQAYRQARLNRQLPTFMQEINTIKSTISQGQPYGSRSAAEAEYLLEELLLWMQNLSDLE